MSVSEAVIAGVAGITVGWVCLVIGSDFQGHQPGGLRRGFLACLELVRQFAVRQVSWTGRSRIERRLLQAGLWHWQVADFVLLHVAAVMFGCLLGQCVLQTLLAGVICALVFWAYIQLWVRQKTRQYSARIARHLPSFLDLLCLCLGAGMSFNAALLVVLRYSQDGPLRVLWQDWLFDVRAGCTRIEALNRLRNKSTQPSLQRLCIAMIQAEKSGSALMNSLKLQSRQLRREQMVSAEKRAAQAPMRMLLPLLVCFFPSTFLVLGFSIWVGMVDVR